MPVWALTRGADWRTDTPVLLNRLDGGNRAQTTPSPGGNGGPWDREMPGESPRTSAEHLLPQAVVVGTARLWRGREDGHRASIARRGSASEILSDSEGGALAYRKLGKVFARSCVENVAAGRFEIHVGVKP